MREALGKLEALGSGVLGEEKKQLRRALEAKEAEFKDAVRRHRELKVRGVGTFLPAASSTMAAPSGRSVGGGGRGAARGALTSPMVGRGGNRGARGGRRGSWVPTAGNWSSLPHPSQLPLAQSSPQVVSLPAASVAPPPSSPVPSLPPPPPVHAPAVAPTPGLNRALLEEFAEFLAKKQQQ